MKQNVFSLRYDNGPYPSNRTSRSRPPPYSQQEQQGPPPYYGNEGVEPRSGSGGAGGAGGTGGTAATAGSFEVFLSSILLSYLLFYIFLPSFSSSQTLFSFSIIFFYHLSLSVSFSSSPFHLPLINYVLPSYLVTSPNN